MFHHLKVGDKVTRMMGGTIPMPMIVVGLDNGLIQCRPEEAPNFPDVWEFDPETGAEVDDRFNWGPKTYTGSFLRKESPRESAAN